jgi:hypothetical protein
MKTAPTLADDPVSGFDPDAVTVSDHGRDHRPCARGVGSAD